MSELFDKQVNVQKENVKKNSGVHTSSCKPTKKCVIKLKVETQKKPCTHKNVFDHNLIRRTKIDENDFRSMILDTKKVLFVNECSAHFFLASQLTIVSLDRQKY